MYSSDPSVKSVSNEWIKKHHIGYMYIGVYIAKKRACRNRSHLAQLQALASPTRYVLTNKTVCSQCS